MDGDMKKAMPMDSACLEYIAVGTYFAESV